ncbi:MAG TPA: hypothetical protein VF407_17615 [Polyangiaceae bacterium]
MNRDDVYRVWVPQGAPYSRFVKPALFAHVDPRRVDAPNVHVDVRPEQVVPPAADTLYRASSRASDVAVVADLPTHLVIATGVALARVGFRPIPVLNGPPNANGEAAAVVHTWPLVAALEVGANALASVQLPLDAPPAFLLHASRQGEREPYPGVFDNRWACSLVDFPMGEELIGRGIRRVVFLREVANGPILSDVHDVLYDWQKSKLEIFETSLDPRAIPTPLVIEKLGFFESLHERGRTDKFPRR